MLAYGHYYKMLFDKQMTGNNYCKRPREVLGMATIDEFVNALRYTGELGCYRVLKPHSNELKSR